MRLSNYFFKIGVARIKICTSSGGVGSGAVLPISRKVGIEHNAALSTHQGRLEAYRPKANH
jgi:hypothetical protein